MATFTYKLKNDETKSLEVEGEIRFSKKDIEAMSWDLKDWRDWKFVPDAKVYQDGTDIIVAFVTGRRVILENIISLAENAPDLKAAIEALLADSSVAAVDFGSGEVEDTEDDALGRLDDLEHRESSRRDSSTQEPPSIIPPLAVSPVVPVIVPAPAAVIPPLALVPIPALITDPLNPPPQVVTDQPEIRLPFIELAAPANNTKVTGKLYDRDLMLAKSGTVNADADGRYYNDKNNFRVGGAKEGVIVYSLTHDDDPFPGDDALAVTGGTDQAERTVNKALASVAPTVAERYGALGMQGSYGSLEVQRVSGAFSYTLAKGMAPILPTDPPALVPVDVQADITALRSGQYLEDFFRYTLQDPANRATGAISFRIYGSNDAPTVTNDVITARETASFSPSGTTTLAPQLGTALGRAQGVLGNDTDVESLLSVTITPVFRYVASISDFAEVAMDPSGRVSQAIYSGAENSGGFRDPAQRFAVSGVFSNLATGEGLSGFGNMTGESAPITELQLRGRFGMLILKADGSYTYTRNAALTAIPSTSVESFSIRLFDLATDPSNKAEGSLAAGSPSNAIGQAFEHSGTTLLITETDLTAGVKIGTVNKSIPSGHQPFNVTALQILDEAGKAIESVQAAEPDATGEFRDGLPGINTGTLTIIGRFGKLEVDKYDGSYTYTPDDGNAAVNALAATDNGGVITRQQLTETIRYTMADENPHDIHAGAIKRDGLLTITIEGANDSPVFTLVGPLSQTTLEDTVVVLTEAQLKSEDKDDGSGDVRYELASGGVPTRGDLLLNGQRLEVGGTFTQAQLTAGSVSYRPSQDYFSGDGTDSIGLTQDRVTLLLKDGGEDGSLTTTVSVALNVNPVNDHPDAAATGHAVTFTEPADGVASGSAFVGGLFSGSTFSVGPANEGAQRLTELRFALSGVQPGQDRLEIEGTEVVLAAGTNVSSVAGKTYSVTSASGELTLLVTGAYTTAEAKALLEGIRFRNTSEDPTANEATPTAASRAVTLTLNRVMDNGNGAAPVTGDDNNHAVNIRSTLAVNNVNDEPRFAAAPAPLVGDYVENGPLESGVIPRTNFAKLDLLGSSILDLVESGDRVKTITFEVSGIQNGQNEVLVTDLGLDLHLEAKTTVVSGVFTYEVTTGSAPGIFIIKATSLTGTATVAEAQSAIDGLGYRYLTDDTVAGERSISLVSIQDNGGTQFSGDDLSSFAAITKTWSVISVNDAPELVATGTGTVATPVSYEENDPGKTVFTNISVTTVEAGQSLKNIVFQVEGLQNGTAEKLFIHDKEFDLAAAAGKTVDGKFEVTMTSPAAGQVQITVVKAGGVMTEAEVKGLVESLRYRIESDDIAAGDRTVRIVSLQDDGGVLNGGVDAGNRVWTSVFRASEVNDAPTLAVTTVGSPAAETVLENGSAVVAFTNAVVSTVEAGQGLERVVFTVRGLSDGVAELITVDGTEFSLIAGVPGTTAGGFSVTREAGANAGEMLVTVRREGGVLSEAEASGMINSIRYRNNSEDPTAGGRTIALTTLQDDGRGADTLSPATAVSTFNVVPVNDAPSYTAVARDSFYTQEPSVGLFDAAAVTNAEAVQTISEIKIIVTGVVDGIGEKLIFGNTSLSLTGGQTLTGLAGDSTATVSLVGGAVEVVIVGSMSPTQASILINSVGYANELPGATAGDRSFTVVSLKDNGGVTPGVDTFLSFGPTSTVKLESDAAPTAILEGVTQDFTENGAPVLIFSNTAAIDPNNTGQTINEIIVTVNGLKNGDAERLTFNGTELPLTTGSSLFGLSGASTATVAVEGSFATVTITGSMTAAQASSLAQTLGYRHLSNDPTGGERNVTVTQVKEDGGLVSNDSLVVNAASKVNVVPINDAPIISAAGEGTADSPLTLNEDTFGALFKGSGGNPISVTAVEGSQGFTKLVFLAGGIKDGAEEKIAIRGTSFGLVAGFGNLVGGLMVTLATTAVEGQIEITVVGDGGGAFDAAAAKSIIESIQYANTAQMPTGGTRELAITALEDDGGTDNGGLNTVSGPTAFFTVAAVNDGPEMTVQTGTIQIFDISDDVAVAIGTGIRVNDPDLDVLTNGQGDYSGTKLKVSREGADVSSDKFTFGPLAGVTIGASTLTSAAGFVFANYTSTQGLLTVAFVNNGTVPTQALIESVAQAVAYSNTEEGVGNKSLEFVFEDGNAGAQGSGGELSDGQIVTVNVVAPVALDLNGDGLVFHQVNEPGALSFDLNGDGVADRSAWVASGDGVLVYDADGNGEVSNRSEFVFTDTGGGDTDFAALSNPIFDSNQDGLLSVDDNAWEDLMVWSDVNGDHVFALDELISLDAMQINSISLGGEGHGPTAFGGVLIHDVGHFQLGDGTIGSAGDVSFAFQPGQMGPLPPVRDLLAVPDVAPEPATPDVACETEVQPVAEEATPEPPPPPPPPYEEVVAV